MTTPWQRLVVLRWLDPVSQDFDLSAIDLTPAGTPGWRSWYAKSQLASFDRGGWSADHCSEANLRDAVKVARTKRHLFTR